MERGRKGSNLLVSSPLSHFHLDIWRNFKILLRQVPCLETKHLITYSRKQGRERPKFSFLCDVFLSAIFIQVYLTSSFHFNHRCLLQSRRCFLVRKIFLVDYSNSHKSLFHLGEQGVSHLLGAYFFSVTNWAWLNFASFPSYLI